MSDEELRDALAAALCAAHDAVRGCRRCLRLGDLLLPVVRAYGDQRAAEALREAANQVHRFGPAVIAKWLRDRADDLAPADTPEAHRG